MKQFQIFFARPSVQKKEKYMELIRKVFPFICHPCSKRTTFRVAPDNVGQATAETLLSPVLAAHQQLHLVLRLIDGSFVLRGVGGRR